MAFNSVFESWAVDKLPVPESWRQAQAQQQQLRDEGANYKTINKVEIFISVANSITKVVWIVCLFQVQNGGGGIPMEDLQRDPELSPTFDEAMSPSSKRPQKPEKEMPEEDDPFEKPVGKGLFAIIKWAIMLPLYFLAKYTIPDCRKEAWAKSYILTFLMAIIWISVYSYLMVSKKSLK